LTLEEVAVLRVEAGTLSVENMMWWITSHKHLLEENRLNDLLWKDNWDDVDYDIEDDDYAADIGGHVQRLW